MKYCKKCGMLLENNLEICIGCGNDVNNKENYSRYPEKLQIRIDEEAKNAKTKRKYMLLIIFLFVVLCVLVGAFVYVSYNDYHSEDTEEVQDTEEDSTEGIIENSVSKLLDKKGAVEEQSKEDEYDKLIKQIRARKVKDDEGTYYTYSSAMDEAGHEVFFSIYPEDLSVVDYSIDYNKYSQIYPAVFTFTATNEENTARFSYMSTQQYFELTMDDGTVKNREIDDYLYLTYYGYSDAKTYLETLIKQGYPQAKSIELTNTVSIDVNDINAFKDKLSGSCDKHALVLKDALDMSEGDALTYKDISVEANIYYYDIVDSLGVDTHCIYYVPVASMKYDYLKDGHSGTLTDWYVLEVLGFEAGSGALYEYYLQAFDLFINNSGLTKDFVTIENMYSRHTVESVNEGFLPDKVTKDSLNKMYSDYSVEASSDFYNAIYEFINISPTAEAIYCDESNSVAGGSMVKQVFLNPDSNTIYATQDESEYPGEEYNILLASDYARGYLVDFDNNN